MMSRVKALSAITSSTLRKQSEFRLYEGVKTLVFFVKNSLIFNKCFFL